MNTSDIYDPRLKPGRRTLMQRISVTSAGLYNGRAERLQMRALERDWSAARTEQLLTLLLERAQAVEEQLVGDAFERRRWARSRNSLARANGWGSAGQCPVVATTKTPAVQAGVPSFTPVTARLTAGGGVR